MKYWWIRIFDYHPPDDQTELVYYDKGTLLDEWYIKGETASRNDAKESVVNKYGQNIKFAKPRKGSSGQYAIVMESNEFFYDRFYKELPDGCICFNCHKPISGKACDFPQLSTYVIENICGQSGLDVLSELSDSEIHFCSYRCCSETYSKLRSYDTIEFQNREGQNTTGIYGYIYHIYNRHTNKHYIGQTKYMPFFRWQEHVKDNVKGDICDLVFEVITKVTVNDQRYLNNIEAWWIQFYTDKYGENNVMNITHPHITIEHLVELYNKAKLNSGVTCNGVKSLFKL